ncbi:PREDICTED: ammonium transporter Rh type A-like isoform X1 [Acropora digitifera]|uniref:ammonium transporter Rh type A-like isoform X1 n=1 Tax=Acropora digitifera TaxID=70779 RepID=UPI00077AFB5D|nr:PREDICTED: ammonium transporter Rh type A-like isoform X1 [Acropora digitifera]
MADEDSHSTARNLLSPETTTCRPTCKKPINGTNIKFTFCSLSLQIVLIVLFMVLVDYGDHSLPTLESTDGSAGTATPATKESKETVNDISLYYPMFQDVHVMIYIGFGFLMTFLKKYGYGAVGYNFFIASLVTQWGTIVSGCFNQLYSEGKKHIELSIQTLVTAEFAAATVLITYGAVLGKVSRLQLLVIGILEVVFYAINELVAIEFLKFSDAGGSILIHTFGAYFGLALSRVLHNKDAHGSHKEGSNYHSDLFAMIGTVFLWMYWPSFNAALVAPDYVAQHRSVINTYFSLSAACVTTFAISPIFQRRAGKWRMSMVHVQNATLAGGVAIGTASNMSVSPWGALLIGCCAGGLSTVGYAYLTPFLTKYTKTHDTCGVNNLHGMPGILGAIAGAIAAAHANVDKYGSEGLKSLFPAMVGDGRTAKVQAGYQLAGLAVALGIAIIGGIITGFVVRWQIFDPPTREQMYDDEDFWEVPTEDDVEAPNAGSSLMVGDDKV